MAKKKVYDEDFKKMIVELYENKKPVAEIKREYGVAEATLYRWIKEYGKIKTSNNETTTNHELKRLKKELAQAKEENEILKKEEVNLHEYETFEEARLAIFEFIEGWYNRKRIHSSIDYKAPIEIENEVA